MLLGFELELENYVQYDIDFRSKLDSDKFEDKTSNADALSLVPVVKHASSSMMPVFRMVVRDFEGKS